MEDNNNLEQKSEEKNINQVISTNEEDSLENSSVSNNEKLDLLNVKDINLMNTDVAMKEEETDTNKTDEKRAILSKPQAVLDELDKLKNASHESEGLDDSKEVKEQSNENESKEVVFEKTNSSEEDNSEKEKEINEDESLKEEVHPSTEVAESNALNENKDGSNLEVIDGEAATQSELTNSSDEKNVLSVVPAVVAESETIASDVNVAELVDAKTEGNNESELKIESETEPETKAETETVAVAEAGESISTAKKLKQYFNFDFWKTFCFDVVFIAFCLFFTFVLVKKWFLSQEVNISGTNQIHASLDSGAKTTIGNTNILVMGIDSVEGTHRSDTIFVLGVNPSKGKITMLSIPRDTRVIIEDKGRKINEILPRYGEPTLRKILEDLLKITISRKVEVGFESFIEVVDAIGGVDINIEKPMHYDDNWGNLHIHFNPGMNHLNGQDALRYVRFRKDAMADLGRIKRQQEFIKAVVKKIMSPSSIVKLPSIIEKAFKYIKTDFTLPEVLTLGKGFNSTDVKVRTMSLPGEARYIDKISYFMPYAEEAVAIGNNYFSDLAIFELEKNYESDKIMPIQSKSSRKKQ